MAKKALTEHTKEELIKMVCHLKECKKFGLVWEEKPEQVATDCQVKLPLLKEVTSKAIVLAPDQPTNLIIEGDNYHALSVLNYTHAGKIDVIYIDPPYNTGNANEWKYNDKFIDLTDAYRHSKWLSMMEKRLLLTKNLLTDDGLIFISIDDNEQAHLKVLCDDIFGNENFISNFLWKKKGTTTNVKGATISSLTEYILCYRKSNSAQIKNRVFLKEDRNYPHNDKDGAYRKTVIEKKNDGGYARKTMLFPILGQTPRDGKRWQIGEETARELELKNRFIIEKGVVKLKIYDFEDKDSASAHPNLLFDHGSTDSATKELKDIFGGKSVFENPKPVQLIKHLVELKDSKNTNLIILDFFAGSGTTGQAVLELNQEDGGNRKFILCTNNENKIAEEVTYPRIKTVITGVRPDGSKYSDDVPANVRYFKTDFVDKDKSNDRLREKMAPLCADMIKIRENCFESVIESDKLKVFKNSDGLVAMIFDNYDLVPHIKKIENLETKSPVNLYVFSYDANTRDWEIPNKTKHKYKSCPIPEGVLAVYRRIFKTKDNTDV